MIRQNKLVLHVFVFPINFLSFLTEDHKCNCFFKDHLAFSNHVLLVLFIMQVRKIKLCSLTLKSWGIDLNVSMSSWFSPSGCWGELGQTASHLQSAFQQTVTVWSVLSAHPHHGRRGWRFLSATWRYCCWKSGEGFDVFFFQMVVFKTICLYLYTIYPVAKQLV